MRSASDLAFASALDLVELLAPWTSAAKGDPPVTYAQRPTAMNHFELPPLVHQWANDVLVWIGFGTVVGLLAKAIMPGREFG